MPFHTASSQELLLVILKHQQHHYNKYKMQCKKQVIHANVDQISK